MFSDVPASAREMWKMGKKFDRLKYAELLKAQRLDDAIAYVDRFRKRDPDDPTLKRRAALARGGKGEDILMSCNRAGTLPSAEQIDTMCDLFKEAIALDPYLADPYWDLAVIHVRFLSQPEQAAGYLADAKRLGYKHAMMKRLEAMIEAAR
jgi:tetratricopeptide (TPR) repeat protein